MIRILKLVLLLVVSQVAFAQAPSNYTNINGRYRWIAGMFDSTFHIPKGSTPSLRTGGSTNAGALFYKTSDSTVRYWTGSNWLTIADTGRFVPYTGAIDTLNMGQFGVKTKFIQFDTSTRTVNDRVLQWSNDNGTLSFGMTNGGTIEQEIGLQQFARVKNVQGSQINKGQVVYLYGASGDRASVKLADNRADSTSSKTLGIAIENIAINGEGFVGTFGTMSGLNLSAYTPGDQLYLDSIPGGLTKTKPQAPYHLVFIGVVERANAGNGLLFTNVQNGYELEELHNVKITTPVRNNALLVYDSLNRLWVDTTLNAIGGVTGSGIANYMTRWTGANSVDTSQIYQSSGLIGIGTITPLAKVDIYDSAATALKVKNRAFGNNQNALEVRTDGVRGYTAILEQRDSVATGTQYMTGFRKGMLPGTGNPAPGGGTSFFTQIGNDNDVYRTTSIFRARAIDTTGFAAGPSIKGSSLEIWTLKNNAFDTTLVLNQGNVGVGTGQNGIDSNLTVQNGAWFERGVRMSGLPSGVGTKALRINANGTLSIADTLANGISGTGTTNYIPKFTSSNAIGNSLLFDNGTNVGINTSSPNQQLEVKGAGLTYVKVSSALNTSFRGIAFGIENNATINGSVAMEVSGGELRITSGYSTYGGFQTFYTNGSERMRLDASGNLGLGVTPSAWNTPAYQVKGASFVGDNTYNAVAKIVSNAYYNGSNFIYISSGQQVAIYEQDFGSHKWYNAPSGTAGNAATMTERMRLDNSGNLGLGVTPSATTIPVLQFGANAVVTSSNTTYLAANATFNSGWKYITSSLPANQYQQTNGGHAWFNAPSGTAGNAISFTQAMTLDASGRLGIGTTSPGDKLEVNGNVYATAFHAVGSIARFVAGGGVYIAGLNGSSYGTVQSYSDASGTGRILSLNPSGGNVGIGTTSPTYKLDVAGNGKFGSGTSSLALKISGDDNYIEFDNTNTYLRGGGNLTVSATSNMIFNANSSERMRLTSGGELLINTTSDAGDYKLQVNGRVYGTATDYHHFIVSNGSAQIKLERTSSSAGSGYIGFDDVGFNVRNSSLTEIFNVTSGGAIKTAAPSGGTAKPYKLGEAGVAIGGSDGYAVKVEIDGTLYYLMTGYLPEPAPEAQAGPSSGYKAQFEQPTIKIKSDNQKIKDLEKEIAELKELIKTKIK